MQNVLAALLSIALAVLAILLMLRLVTIKDLISFSRRGMIALVVFMITGCVIEHALFALLPVIAPIAGKVLAWGSIAFVLLFLLALLTSFITNRGESRRNH